MKFLIVGMGSIGTRHFRNLIDLGHQCVGVETKEGFLAELNNVDGVLICTPNHLHTYYLKECMKTDKAIYVEKPIVINPIKVTKDRVSCDK